MSTLACKFKPLLSHMLGSDLRVAFKTKKTTAFPISSKVIKTYMINGGEFTDMYEVMISRSFTVTQISLWQCGQRIKLHQALNYCISTKIRLFHLSAATWLRHLHRTHHKQNSVNLEQAGLHHTASDVCDYQPSSCSRCLLSGVLIRIVRLVPFRPPEAELGSCDPPVHIFNVFTLSLKVVCGVI